MTPQLLTLVAMWFVVLGALLPRVGLDVVAILVLAFLVIGKVLTPEAAAAGFGNTTLLTVACMFVLAEALKVTGAVHVLDRLARHAGRRGVRALLLTTLPVVMVLSALMNNTGVVVLLLPVFLAASRHLEVSPSRILLPLSYAAILGGTLTLVGTTTNLLVDGIVRQEEGISLAFLDFLPLGAVFCLIGVAYLVLLGPRLLPDRIGLTTLVPAHQRLEYMTEVVLGPKARLVGRTVAQVAEVAANVRVLQVVRGEEMLWPLPRDEELRSGDLLMVKGAPDDLVRLIQQRGLEGPPDPERGGRVLDVTLELAEIMIAPGSDLDGVTVSEARLRERFGIVVLGVLHQGTHMREHLGALRLRVGDILLVQGESHDVQLLANVRDHLVLLGGAPPPAPKRSRAIPATVIGATALLAAAVGLVPLPVAALLASVALVVSGCLSGSQAYRSIDLRILVVLGCMIGLGLAVRNTGIASVVADGLVSVGGRWGTVGILAAVYLATAVLTELVTNVGTAGVMVPIALEVANLQHVSHKPFVLAVAFAASCSLLSPVGYQTNLLVYGPGGYRFFDYARFGLPLAVLLWIAAVLLLPVFHPF